MKGLLSVPTVEELRKAYSRLERLDGDLSDDLPENEIAMYSQWARLDPRLAELLTEYLLRHGHQIHAFKLLNALVSLPWPRALLVPLRFAELKLRADRDPRIAAFDVLVSAIERAFPTKTNDLYFIPLQRPNRILTEEAILYQSEPYARSGFVGAASLLSKGRVPLDTTVMTKGARQRVLQRLIGESSKKGSGKEITVESYITACKGMVSRRQAQRDLENEPQLKAIGFTRNRRYRRVL